MHQNHTIDVLSVITTFSNREFGPADVKAWHLILQHLDFNEALEAVAHHHKVSAFPIKPFDIADHIRRASNDAIDRANVDQSFRDARDSARDDRVAELVGGDRRAIGTSPHRGNPADDSTRQRVVREISEKFGRRSDSSKVLALGDLDNLTIDTIMEKLSAPGERWDRNRAAKALHAAYCINAGEEPPTVTYVRPERRTVTVDKKARKARDRRAKADAVAHFATRGYQVSTAFKEGAA